MARILHMRNGKIEPIESTKILKEANLHDYLENHPELIPFQEIDDDPPNALVIGREVRVTSGSIDLLIVDALGRLTIVETKLAKNSESRREVVGQIIEYASFRSQWTADQVERQAVGYLKCGSAEKFYLRLSPKDEPDERIEVTAFKKQVEKNLKDGNLRLVVAVDEIVESVRSIVVFLNSFTRFDFVLLQLHEYSLGNDDHVFIPSLFGQMKPTSQRPSTRIVDREGFFEGIDPGVDSKIRAYIERIYDRFSDWTVEEYWTSGIVLRFYYLRADIGDVRVTVARLSDHGDLTICFGELIAKGLTKSAAGLAEQLNQISGIQFPSDLAGKKPKVPREVLLDDVRLDAVLAALRECALGAND